MDAAAHVDYLHRAADGGLPGQLPPDSLGLAALVFVGLCKMMRRAIQLVCAWAVTLLAALPASAQCVMCYKAVEGSGSRTIQFLKIGIFILLIPTLFVFASIALMAYRRRKGAFGDSNQE